MNSLKANTCPVIANQADVESHALDAYMLRDRKLATDLLMCPPNYFEVKDVKNAFMEGQIANVDIELAKTQWQELKSAFQSLGYPVQTIDPVDGLEDMVFSANQVLVGMRDEAPYAVMAHMKHESRRREVPHFKAWFQKHNYQILDLPSTVPVFEGHGDAIWHYDRQMLWGGWGFRTSEAAYPHLAQMLDVPIAKLHLVNPKFYHLDTAFCVLDRDTVMIYAGAFDHDGLWLIKHFFKNVIEVSQADADNFACNALALGKNVVIEKGNASTVKQLTVLGFKPIEVDTSEFKKSGGSVFCLKCEIYAT